eukprot:COSAG06_NODE_1483_length_9302_cov_14.188525_8_plen_114_part_00
MSGGGGSSSLGESLLRGVEPEPEQQQSAPQWRSDRAAATDVAALRGRRGSVAEDIIAAKSSIGGSCGLAACMMAMGVSSFPVCETLLLQTSMFSNCFMWGPAFYGRATLCLCA